jgi:hypothetical protein
MQKSRALDEGIGSGSGAGFGLRGTRTTVIFPFAAAGPENE